MPQSLAKNTLHLIFGTKDRTPWLRPDVQDRLYAYLAGILQEWESPAIAIGGHEDHVHILFVLSKNHALKKVVEEVKKSSSKWMKTIDNKLRDFAWQHGYGAFSVSESNVLAVKGYIARQAEHHRRNSFQDELRQFFARHGIEVDERYLWS